MNFISMCFKGKMTPFMLRNWCAEEFLSEINILESKFLIQKCISLKQAGIKKVKELWSQFKYCNHL